MQAFGVATLGRDAEVRYTAENQAVTNLALAFTYGSKADGPDGKRPTQWVDATLWGARAEKLAEYMKKGSKVLVTLRDVHIKSFKRSDETTSYTIAGTVDQIELVARPKPAADQQQAAPAPRQPAPAPAPRPAPAQRTSSGGFDDMEDDIPF